MEVQQGKADAEDGRERGTGRTRDRTGVTRATSPPDLHVHSGGTTKKVVNRGENRSPSMDPELGSQYVRMNCQHLFERSVEK